MSNRNSPVADMELRITAHLKKPGWRKTTVIYDTANPEHVRRVEAALTALFGPPLPNKPPVVEEGGHLR